MGIPHLIPPILAQEESGSVGGVILWALIIIGFVIAGFIVTSYIRRKVNDDDDDLSTPGGGGFTLNSLRELHEQGKLTTSEFEKAKFAIVQNVKAQEAAKVAAAKEKNFPLGYEQRQRPDPRARPTDRMDHDDA